MNLTDYTYLLNKPEAINERYAETLENVLEEFPYFQSARVLRLKHLYNQDSFKYNYALKVAAAFTTPFKPTKSQLPPAFQRIEDKLASHFSTRVKLKHSRNGSGQIIIDYYSQDEFNKILGQLDAPLD